jgi:hypothetical protein
MTEPEQPAAVSSQDIARIEHALTTVFPDDAETIGTERLREIATNPTKPIGGAYRPEVGGEQADIVGVLDLLRDAAVIAYYSILISIELKKADPKGQPPKKEDVKKEVEKQIKDGKLKVSARVLGYVDKIIGALKDIVQ